MRYVPGPLCALPALARSLFFFFLLFFPSFERVRARRDSNIGVIISWGLILRGKEEREREGERFARPWGRFLHWLFLKGAFSFVDNLVWKSCVC